ncbi:MAG TPA: hypothetical protein VFJ06_01555 [Halococcus sp.]|nr:hypothetical protein [Halococcus sp.]
MAGARPGEAGRARKGEVGLRLRSSADEGRTSGGRCERSEHRQSERGAERPVSKASEGFGGRGAVAENAGDCTANEQRE